MNKRQAKICAALITASFNAGSDAFGYAEGLDEKSHERLAEATQEMGWKVLWKHGFEHTPSAEECIAYALKK